MGIVEPLRLRPKRSQPLTAGSRLPVTVGQLPQRGNDIDLIERLSRIAVNQFHAALAANADDNATFRTLLKIDIDGEAKPLLVVGTTHGRVEDGNCLVVLNPEPALLPRLDGGYGCHAGLLKDAVTKRCDAAVGLWIDAYKPNGVIVASTYRNRSPAPARFDVREFWLKISTGCQN